MTSLRILGLCALGLGMAGVAGAHPAPPKCMPKSIQAKLPAYDANGNGKLDPDEHRQMMDDQRAADVEAYDANGDGALDDKERAALHRDRAAEHFAELDANGDGAIARAEAKGSCTPVEHRFDDIDADADGRITWAELQAAGKRFGPPRHR